MTRLRESRPKHFWGSAVVAGTSLFGVVTAFAVAPTTMQLQASQQYVVESIQLPAVHSQADDSLYIREDRVQRGDTIARLLTRMGVDDLQAMAFLRDDLRARPLVQQLRPGKWITTRTDASGKLFSLTFPLNDGDLALVVERNGEELSASEQALNLETRISTKTGQVRTSIFAATDAAGIPDEVAKQLTDVFGTELDFQHDVRRGDRFTVVYETLYHQGQALRTGRILAAEFTHRGKSMRAVNYPTSDADSVYFSPAGKSYNASFLRSPLEISRITSGFEMRLHPILNDWRAHKGVDFAAPTGTGVKATGDGIIDFIGQQSGYGNIIVLRHQGKYTTYYGHLNGFVDGLKLGDKVRQGELIGFVGMTGRATGPHLHYEFRVEDEPQDPMSAALPTGTPLKGAELAEFKRRTDSYLAHLDVAKIPGAQVALLD